MICVCKDDVEFQYSKNRVLVAKKDRIYDFHFYEEPSYHVVKIQDKFIALTVQDFNENFKVV